MGTVYIFRARSGAIRPARGRKIYTVPIFQQRNEPVRTPIALLSNGGLALFGAFAAVIYSGNGTDDALAMVIFGMFLISGAFAASALLEEET